MRNEQQHKRTELLPEETLKIIFNYAIKISRERDLYQLLKMIADLGRDLVVADRCTIWLVDQERQTLWTTIAHGVERIEIPIDSGLAGHAVTTGESLIIDDAYLDARFNNEVDIKTGYRTKSIIVIPVRNHEEAIIGCIQAINKMTDRDTFNEQDLRQLTLAASYTGQSLETLLIQKELDDAEKEIIYKLAEIGESRSKETGNHVKRVAEYSRILALGAGLSKEEADLITIASPMHDIGKVAIPDAILKKPGKLTIEEFETMKTHAAIGYQLLNNSTRKVLQTAAIIAYEHHEKWNGTGYPCGKSGDGIHLYGRITAIADVFDALASDRYYKKAWPLDEILTLMRNERGQHFDPFLVDVFFQELDKIIAIKEMYKDDPNFIY